MNEQIVTDTKIESTLRTVGAQFVREVGGARVYVAKQINTTITVFPGPKPGTKRVRTTRGCTC